MQQRALAAAALADDGETLAGREVQVDAGEDGRRLILAGIAGAQTAHGDGGAGRTAGAAPLARSRGHGDVAAAHDPPR